MEERCANMTLIPALIYSPNIHWRHIIGQYSSNRAALVDLMSNSRSEIDYELYYYHINEVSWFLGPTFFRCLFVSPAHETLL